MYDKQGSVLRIETTTNNPAEFKRRRRVSPEIPDDPVERRKAVAKLSRHLRLLRAHKVIRRIDGTHRYVVTGSGRLLLTAVLGALDASVSKLKNCA